ncbi:MAG: hypothetical protein H6908_00890 [Hyphomicrobiales bacterium]|nr:hypothetical protein [Hyphomicrobiales bacterium]
MDVKGSSGSVTLYALIFEKNVAPRRRAIEKLKGRDIPYLQNIIDAGYFMQPASQTYRYAIILEQISYPSMTDVLHKTGPLPENIISAKFLGQIAEVLRILDQDDLVHGTLNTSTIYYDVGQGRIVIQECVSTYCGQNQPGEFECLDAAMCIPTAKGERQASVDYMALGLLVTTLLLGRNPFHEIPPAELLERRLAQGTYDIIKEQLTRSHLEFSMRMINLIKGLCTDHDTDRWGNLELQAWIKKRDAQAPVSRLHKQAITPFRYGGKEIFSRKYLAYLLYQDWDDAKKNLDLPELSRWLGTSLKRPDLGERIEILYSTNRGSAVLQDERLARVLTTIDPGGPIRYLSVSMNIHGIGTALAFAAAEGNRDLLQQVLTAFTEDLAEHWINLQEEPQEYTFAYLGWVPSTMMRYLRSRDIGFGYERVLYELNPSLPCQGEIVGAHVITDMANLMRYLDSVGKSTENREKEPLDRHIAAFIGSRVDLASEVRVRAIQRYPNLSKNPHVVMLALLTVAQSEAHTPKLTGLTAWMLYRLQSVFDALYSTSIRRELEQRLTAAARTGSLKKMYDILGEEKLIKRDSFGFREAKRQYQALQYKMLQLKSQRNTERLAYQKGLRVAVACSYIVFIITTLLILYRSF